LETCPPFFWGLAAVKATVELRSSLLQEAWDLAADSPLVANGATQERALLEHAYNTTNVSARRLATLLEWPAQDREERRRGCLECATSVLRAFARAARNSEHSQPSPVRLLQIVDNRLTAHENCVLSGEATYALDLDALRGIPATAGVPVSELVSDGGDDRTADWEGLERAAVGLVVSAVRAVANIDSVDFGSPPSVSTPPTVLGQLCTIVDQVDRATQGLPEEPQQDGNRVGRLLREALGTNVPRRVGEDLTRAGARRGTLSRALAEIRAAWLGLAARELEIVRVLDGELTSPSYAQVGSLREAVTAGAANVLAGGRLLNRPGEFHLLDALVYHYGGLALAAEQYAAPLRSHEDAQTKTQLLVLRRLLHAVAALWVIDARLVQLRAASSV
jgi:hypothetical protein